MKKYTKGKDEICRQQSRFDWNDDSHITTARLLVDKKNELTVLFEIRFERNGGQDVTVNWVSYPACGNLKKPKLSLVHNLCLKNSYHDNKMKRDGWSTPNGKHIDNIPTLIQHYLDFIKFNLL